MTNLSDMTGLELVDEVLGAGFSSANRHAAAKSELLRRLALAEAAPMSEDPAAAYIAELNSLRERFEAMRLRAEKAETLLTESDLNWLKINRELIAERDQARQTYALIVESRDVAEQACETLSAERNHYKELSVDLATAAKHFKAERDQAQEERDSESTLRAALYQEVTKLRGKLASALSSLTQLAAQVVRGEYTIDIEAMKTIGQARRAVSKQDWKRLNLTDALKKIAASLTSETPLPEVK